MNVLRPSLLPGLLDSLAHNIRHRNTDLSFFELGRVFLSESSNSPNARGDVVATGAVREERRLALTMTGKRNPLFWSGAERDAQFEIHDLKGTLEEFFEHFGARGISFARRAEPTELFVQSGTIQLGKFYLGELGQVSPVIAQRYDSRAPIFLAELSLDVLLARRNPAKSFKALPSRPSVRRDIAMLLPESVTHETVLSAVKKAKPADLESVELFDVFHGKNVPPGQKSAAYAFIYRSAEKNLTDAEVNAEHEKLIAELKRALGATVRE